MKKETNLAHILKTFQTLIKTYPDLLSSPVGSQMQTQIEQLNFFHLENIGNQINIGLFICDTEGTVLYINQENEKLVGLKYDAVVGKNYKELSTDNQIGNVIIEYVLKHQIPYSSIAYSSLTGTQLLETGSPLFNQAHKLVGVIVLDQDISETMTLAENLRDSESQIAHYQKMVNQNSLIIEQLNQQNIIPQKNFSDWAEVHSPAVTKAYAMAFQAAQTDVTTLLTGETGTGKEVFANYIFEHSSRNKKPFIKVNCAAIPEHLLESELFGYVKGAFTGANANGKVGMFELANNGTLFLDEIGELPLDFQAKLLRALQQKEITRIGDTKSIKLDIRIIAATNRNLSEMVQNGTFRGDLYYRLYIFPIAIPALRERVEDIPTLIQHFLTIFNRKYSKNIILAQDTIDGLCRYQWPGNIRELENLIERWVVIYEPYTTIRWDMVIGYFSEFSEETQHSHFEGHTLKELVSEYEKEILEWGYQKYGSTRALAKALGVDHSTIVRKAQALDCKLQKNV